jgi:hypothetical protein
MTARLIRLRFAGACVECSAELPKGAKAWWDAGRRTITCSDCGGPEGVNAVEANPSAPECAESELEAPAPLAAGEAGGSARREYQLRHQRREQQIDQRWGRLSGVVKFLSDDPQSIRAWAKGSEGEQRLAAHLLAAVGDRAILLNDRKVPRIRGNIDHLVIAASGIWVIDAKHYRGLVTQRDVGRWLKTDLRLYVGRRDRTALAEGLGWQMAAVRKALGGADVPVTAALCFIEADWKLFAKPFQQNRVWVTWPKKLAEMIGEPGPLTPADVAQLADRLAGALPPAAAASKNGQGG